MEIFGEKLYLEDRYKPFKIKNYEEVEMEHEHLGIFWRRPSRSILECGMCFAALETRAMLQRLVLPVTWALYDEVERRWNGEDRHRDFRQGLSRRTLQAQTRR